MHLSLLCLICTLASCIANDTANSRASELLESQTLGALYELSLKTVSSNGYKTHTDKVSELFDARTGIASIELSWRAGAPPFDRRKRLMYHTQSGRSLELIGELGVRTLERDLLLEIVDANSALAQTRDDDGDSIARSMQALDDKVAESRCHMPEHVRGVTRLLYMLADCLRHEFKLDAALKGQPSGTRPLATDTYELSLSTGNKALSVHLITEHSDGETELRADRVVRVLMTQLPTWSLEVEVFALHKSDARLPFALPIGRGLSGSLVPAPRADDDDVSDKTRQHLSLDEFSFKASLRRKRRGHEWPLRESASLAVAYDANERVLARQLSTVVSDVHLLADGQSRYVHTSRLVFDANSGHKYHIVDHDGDLTWSANNQNECVSDALTITEQQALGSSSSASSGSRVGDAFLIDEASSLLLGTAQVRGVECLVYERQLNRVPLWLAADERNSDSHTIGARKLVFATQFVAASSSSGDTNNIMRVLISFKDESFLNNDDDGDAVWTHYELDVREFERSAAGMTLVEPEQLGLADIGQACLFSPATPSGHLRVDMLLEPTRDHVGAARAIWRMHDSELGLEAAVSRALTQLFNIARTQLTQQHVRILPGEQLSVQAELYDAPVARRLQVSVLGRARDTSLSTGAPGTSGVAVSLDECVWRVAHTLRVDAPAEQAQRALMFCAHTMRCVMQDAQWPTDLRAIKSVPGVFEFVGAGGSYELQHPLEKVQLCTLAQVSMRALSQAEQRQVSRLDVLRSRRAQLAERTLLLQLHSASRTSHPLDIADLKMRFLSLDIRGGSAVAKPRHSQLVGYGYASDKASDVASEVECAHRCALQHDCASYSVCRHENARISCVLARLDVEELAQADKSGELSRVLQSGARTSPKAADTMRLTLAASEEFLLRRSPLCAILKRKPYIGWLFERAISRARSGEQAQTSAIEESLLGGISSAEECARFCVDRSRIILLSQLKASSTSEFSSRDEPSESIALADDDPIRQATCTSFLYNEQAGACELLPHVRVHAPQVRAAGDAANVHSDWPLRESAARANRWRAALELGESIGGAASAAAAEAFELFELDSEHLYVARAGERLIARNKNDDDDRIINVASEWQIAVQGPRDVRECARMCVQRARCRSFDTRDAAASVGRAVNCVLNSVSLNDIVEATTTTAPKCTGALDIDIAPSSAGLRLASVHSTGDDSLQAAGWWHHEPTELLEYLTSDDLLLGLASSKQQQQQQQQNTDISAGGCDNDCGVFIDHTRHRRRLWLSSIWSSFGSDAYSNVYEQVQQQQQEQQHDERSTLARLLGLAQLAVACALVGAAGIGLAAALANALTGARDGWPARSPFEHFASLRRKLTRRRPIQRRQQQQCRRNEFELSQPS